MTAKPVSTPFRPDTKRRASRNQYLTSGPGVLRRVSQTMAGIALTDACDGFSQTLLNEAVQVSCGFIDTALRGKLMQEPALWLRRASLMQLDSTLPGHAKSHAIERATRSLELSLQAERPPAIDVHHPIHLNAMIGLAAACELQERQDLTLRLLDIIDVLDPDGDHSANRRFDLRERCQPLTIRAYIPPARPDAISPSALPPAISNRP